MGRKKETVIVSVMPGRSWPVLYRFRDDLSAASWLAVDRPQLAEEVYDALFVSAARAWVDGASGVAWYLLDALPSVDRTDKRDFHGCAASRATCQPEVGEGYRTLCSCICHGAG